MSRDLDLSRPVPRARPLPENLTDAQWWADAERRYGEYWRDFIGGPETFQAGANWFYLSGEFGAAVLMYQKAIDVLHSLYCCGDLSRRQPSPADLAITDGYLNSLGASLSMHPDAPVKDSIEEVAHRLEDIRATCKTAGISPDLYRQALLNLQRYATPVGVYINTAALAESKAVVNHGIMVGDNNTGIAIASGREARAMAFGVPLSHTAPEHIDVLLQAFIAELGRIGHPDLAELAEVVDEARQELAAPVPRLARLRVLAKGLASAVVGATSLAALASQIEQAIHGL